MCADGTKTGAAGGGMKRKNDGWRSASSSPSRPRMSNELRGCRLLQIKDRPVLPASYLIGKLINHWRAKVSAFISLLEWQQQKCATDNAPQKSFHLEPDPPTGRWPMTNGRVRPDRLGLLFCRNRTKMDAVATKRPLDLLQKADALDTIHQIIGVTSFSLSRHSYFTANPTLSFHGRGFGGRALARRVQSGEPSRPPP